MRPKLLCLSLAIISGACLHAEDTPKLELTPKGRILIDGAVYASPQKDKFPDGMAIPEMRVGVKMKYGKWSSLIDVGYAYSKVGLRNMWIEYGFTPTTSLRIGNFIHQFGLESNSTSQKSTFEQPLVSALYTPGLQMGAMVVHYTPSFFGAFSGHVESAAKTQVMNEPAFCQQGYGLLTRLVWRKAGEDQPVTLHAGISGGFATPQQRIEDGEDVHDGFRISALFPTKVTQLTAIGTTVTDARNLFKMSPEFLVASRRMALCGQYFFQQINRKAGLEAYRTHGGYVTLRGILFGENYSYSSANAMLAFPKSKTLECLVDYNYATLSDSKAAIRGGRANSFNVTFNYYFNPYITARLNYSYTHTWDRTSSEPMTLNAFQARLMVLF